ncbi:TPA: transposase [Staphylococcus aureus]|uniref:Mu transposase C-terminal domain-containing protein n=1 Tax=Staphylococcus aureus TaxID=1280 RepID=UPI0015F582B9|nr:Mu transposase C-terminal domain-containing protein [Staphylococcus aureus]MBA5947580.1 DDE-type integrase/transposase/recombinase [Staphylococcus aureus]MCG5194965.1 Mu transposase C-terminal domain-containing protein [Staphylococcus aureus]WIZ91158.1 Mu transposase C-terminal domain-containing protein [Staphylococcus aureus]HCX9494688.1 transposase [Staphylococcus aureus]HCY6793333.1 transposase [Staphylococcus aureus]
MNFYINEILQDYQQEKTYRILWIDSGNIIMYILELNNFKAFPEKKLVSEISDLIVIGDWRKIIDTSYDVIVSNEYEKKHYEARDAAWAIIEAIVKEEPAIYEKSFRTKLVKEAQEKHHVTYPTVRKYLYKYWSRGKTIDALLPDYKNSGGKGKQKKAGESKRGRPPVYGVKGINIDEETKRIFRLAIEKYYLTSKQNSLTAAYKFMLKEFYVENIYYENGVEKVLLKDEEAIPTLTQFKYWYQKEYNAPEVLIARKGEKRFNKDHRAVLNTSQSEVFGPGSRYQIDATIADVYLVSEVNRNWIIGRPVVYLVMDVFSRMVVGIYVGLEGPSWAGAMMAMTNVVADKKKYCAQYGIEINEEDWPSHHLPEILLADKGEFEGYNVERLVKAFNLHVENAASYRADWKGIVEKQFDLIQKKVKPLLPGYIDVDFQERGAKDYRLDAKLTLREFTQILIKQILQYNTKHYLKSYERDRDLVADDVQPIPLYLWNWGIKNRTGKLRAFAEELVKLQLLPRGKATVNHKGIQFKGISYSCDKAIQESWFENARMKGSWKMEIAYDPRNMNYVYVLNGLDSSFEACYMLEVSKRYEGLSLDEITYWKQQERLLEKGQDHKQFQKDLDYIADVEAIIKEAEKEKKAQQDSTLSKAEQVGAIRDNRKAEKDRQRIVESETIIEKRVSETEVIAFPQTVAETDFKRPNVREFLKRRKGDKDE